MSLPERTGHNPTITAADIAGSQKPALRRYRTWQRFHRRLRSTGRPLLKALPQYPTSVLVAGCQRSGTTMLTRVIAGSRGFQRFRFTHDDELDAALILAGEVDVPQSRRYCFQSTYLNECYREYRSLQPHQRLIWVLRNPYSVVHSMIFNWRRFALRELYAAVGTGCSRSLTSLEAWIGWFHSPSPAEMACAAYRGKTAQVLAIREFVRPSQLMVVDYDELVQTPGEWFRRIFAFIGEPFDVRCIDGVRADSIRRADTMSPGLKRRIDEVAMPTYRKCVSFVSHSES
jgi:hypothetical protein